MRLIALVGVALLLAACGSAEERTGVPGFSDEATASEEGTATDSTATGGEEDTGLQPPPIVLVSAEGRQKAVQGSYCVSGNGQGACADMAAPARPRAVTAVRAGDRVSVVIEKTRLEKESILTIRPLGCFERAVKTLELPRDGELEWLVDLEPGAYQLDVFVYFTAEDGSSGDTNGTLGLTVAGPKSDDALGVLRIKPAMEICEFAE